MPVLSYPSKEIPPQLQLLITPLKIIRSKTLKKLGSTISSITSDTFKKGKEGEIVSFTTQPSSQAILLPIPSSFSTNLSHNWNEITSFYTDMVTNIKGFVTSAMANVGKVQTLLAGQGLSTYDPKIVHYASTQPLEFSFNWKFTPKSKKETKSIYEITKVFQLGSMPKGVTGKKGIGVLRGIKAPHLWKLQFQPTLRPPNRLAKNYFFNSNTLDEMILTSCNINYTPEGDFFPFVDGSPTSLDMSLSFKMSRSILSYAKVFGLERQQSALVDSVLPD